MPKFEVVSQNRVFDGFVKLDVAQLRIQQEHGWSEPMERISADNGDAAAVVLYDRTRNKLLFVRQFRFPLLRHGHSMLLELVAGKIDEGETAEQSAEREVLEEVGVRVKGLQHVAAFFPSPGILAEKVSVFYAETEGEREQQDLDDGEDVELVELSPQEVWKMLDHGEITDGKTLVGLLWLRTSEKL